MRMCMGFARPNLSRRTTLKNLEAQAGVKLSKQCEGRYTKKLLLFYCLVQDQTYLGTLALDVS